METKENRRIWSPVKLGAIVAIMLVTALTLPHAMAAEGTQPGSQASEGVTYPNPAIEKKGPDLQVTDLEVDVLPAGQKDLHGNTHSADRYYFVFYVRNMGNEIAVPSRFKATFTVLSGSPTGTANLAYEKNIPQLWPNPNDVSGAHTAYNSPPFVKPDAPVTFRFRGEIDINHQVSETSETNNVLVKTVTVPPATFQQAPILEPKKVTPGMQQQVKPTTSVKPPSILYPRKGQVFMAPAHIIPRVMGSGKVQYVLKKASDREWAVLKNVVTTSFTITDPGSYCVATTPGSHSTMESECIPFAVKAKEIQLRKEETTQQPGLPRATD